MNFDYEDFSLNEFLDSNPSFDEVRELMKDLLYALYDCNELEDRLYNEDGITIASYTKKNNVEDDLSKVAHLVMNNAFFSLSNGAEGTFVYQLTKEDKKNYRFSMLDLKELDKIIYGGYLGTIDFQFENGDTFPDDNFDCQDMEMVASFMYDNILNGKKDED